jgi:hypothetical protein
MVPQARFTFGAVNWRAMVPTTQRPYLPQMKTRSQQALRMASLAALAFAMACGQTSFKADAPAILNDVGKRPKLAELRPSVVDAPIAYAVGPVMAALNDAVPFKFGNMAKRIQNPSNKRQQFAFQATRTPFKMALDSENLTLSTVINYQGRGWYSPIIGPDISAGCGEDSLKPRLRVAVISELKLTTDWQFHPHTKVRAIDPLTTTTRDECRVSFLSINVTDKVVGAVRDQLQQKLPKVDATLARFDLRSHILGWYNLLNKPVKISDSVWIVFNPGIVRYGGLHLNDSTLVADIRLFAQPTIVTGAKPQEKYTALPPLERAARTVGDSARVMIEAELGYDVASAMLKKQLVGRTFTRFGRKVRIAYVRCYGLGDGRLAVGVKFSGSISGEGYLVGTPKFDPASNMLYVPDLDFDVSTSNKLVQGLAWLKKGDVITQLREAARFPLTDVLDAMRLKVEEKINRDLTEGVHLTATLRTGRVIDVAALQRAMIVRAEAVGSIGLTLDRDLPIKQLTGKKKVS